MTAIQDSPYPLVFPVAGERTRSEAGGRRVEVRALARALAGMQKEALISVRPGAHTWRMVCDEGPYLNGTDLAPFPLAFFATGLVNAYVAEIVAAAAAKDLPIDRLEVIQDNFYTMEGSAVRGDMIGGALPVALHVQIDSPAGAAEVQGLVMDALLRSPGDAYLRTVHASEFSIVKNGKPVTPGDVPAWNGSPAPALNDAIFDAATPAAGADFPPDIITKLGGAETVFHVEGGAGSSLKSEQKRTLHIRSIAKLHESGLTETQVQLFKPIGSNFRFLCDINDMEGSGAAAPAPLAYLAAGIAFCYLTQIGRYAMIMKYDDLRYAIAQDMAFALADPANNAPPSVEPVRTHVALETSLDDDIARKIVDMGERTCFLHAVSRTPLKAKVRVTDIIQGSSGGGGEDAAAAALR